MRGLQPRFHVSRLMYKLHLILKYLLKRRIAWVSLIAVILCTTMVLVVISVMGGWLNMFKSSFHGLSGDIVIESNGLAGFDHYEQIIDRLKQNPNIAAAVPTIETYGLLRYGSQTTLPVEVMGIPIVEISKVNKFHESLFRQHTLLAEELKDPNLNPERRKQIEHRLHEPPSFDLLNEVSVPMDAPPGDLKVYSEEGNDALEKGAILLPAQWPRDLQDQLRGKLRYDAVRHRLAFTGVMQLQWKEPLASLSVDANYKKAIDQLFQDSTRNNLLDYTQGGRDKGKYYGMIVGAGVIGIHRNREGQWEGREPWKFETKVTLTVLGIQQGAAIDLGNKAQRDYYVIDDSRTQVWQYDNKFVYVPLEVLQKDLGMQQQDGEEVIDKGNGNFEKTDHILHTPARVTSIHIKVKDGIDPNDENKLHEISGQIRQTVAEVLSGDMRGQGMITVSPFLPRVVTWQDQQRLWINAVENEKLLTVVLFGIISVVAIFLIFCIFYMIVVEKTRDIGIIKSVGATSAGVAQIFLGYGLVIGLIGAALGLALSYGIVHNINELHTWLGKALGVQIWNPEVYLFDKIPNTMSGHDLAIILPIAVVASVLGALVPAIRAARMNPVEALRWE